MTTAATLGVPWIMVSSVGGGDKRRIVEVLARSEEGSLEPEYEADDLQLSECHSGPDESRRECFVVLASTVGQASPCSYANPTSVD